MDRPGRVDSLFLAALGLIGLVMFSMVAGGAFGVLALMGMGITTFGSLAFLFGCAIGLMLSPVFVWALWEPPRIIGLLVTIAPTAALSYGTGVLTGGGGDGNPLACAFVSGVAYIGLGLGFGRWARKRRTPDPSTFPRCPACGYSLSGLPVDVKCPECGRQC